MRYLEVILGTLMYSGSLSLMIHGGATTHYPCLFLGTFVTLFFLATLRYFYFLAVPVPKCSTNFDLTHLVVLAFPFSKSIVWLSHRPNFVSLLFIKLTSFR